MAPLVPQPGVSGHPPRYVCTAACLTGAALGEPREGGLAGWHLSRRALAVAAAPPCA